ncbi:unnamed protein product [Mytilus edulis]|uniref:C-terminal of Roc (COR) domain-containing protein n=1 Tax=Mytilus edulis TaxID=6550 RepID=A0A8S3RVV6_MYTED|nr:unnamed protein product [Mytilus edulis]
MEFKNLDKKSAKVFASLLEEERYEHYEVRVMLAGEQGTGKTTIARYLVGYGPTKITISTDGIDLFNGLSFIDRENKKWLRGKQGFTLLEVAISRSLRTDSSTSINIKEMAKTADQDTIFHDSCSHPKFTTENLSLVTDKSAQYIATKEQFTLKDSMNDDKEEIVWQDHKHENKCSSYMKETQQACTVDKIIEEKHTTIKSSKEPSANNLEESAEETEHKERNPKEDILDGNQLQTIELYVPANEQENLDQTEKSAFKTKKENVEITPLPVMCESTAESFNDNRVTTINAPVSTEGKNEAEERFLQESLKVGRKKLHQRKLVPVIIWDFGGQDVFYSTHQTFLTYRAIYLIVLDGSRTLDDPCPFEQYLPGKSGPKTARDYLKFWINTIVTYCKGSGPGFPKIIIVLTHKDKVKAEDVELKRQQLFLDIEKMFSGSTLLSHLVIKDQIFVNAKNARDPEMVRIKRIITEQAFQQPTWGQELPKCFILLEVEFDSLVSRNIPMITMEHMKQINSLQPVRPLTEDEMKVFLKFQHSVGRILYFEEPKLINTSFLHPLT